MLSRATSGKLGLDRVRPGLLILARFDFRWLKLAWAGSNLLRFSRDLSGWLSLPRVASGCLGLVHWILFDSISGTAPLNVLSN